MPKLISFTSVSLDGYFASLNGDMSWAHADPNDAEWNAFVAGNTKGESTLVFGRVTYQMMASYWPTPMAAQQNGTVAEKMNRSSKLVFSRTLSEATWSNTTLIKDDLPGAIRRLKQGDGLDMAILGSGSIVAQLTEHGLIDEVQIVVVPVVLGAGKSLFAGAKGPLRLIRKHARTFENGNVALTYAPRG